MRRAAIHRQFAATVLRAGGQISVGGLNPESSGGWLKTENGIILPSNLAPIYKYVEGGEISSLVTPVSCISKDILRGVKFVDESGLTLKLDTKIIDYEAVEELINLAVGSRGYFYIVCERFTSSDLDFFCKLKNPKVIRFDASPPLFVLRAEDFVRAVNSSPVGIHLDGGFEIDKEEWENLQIVGSNKMLLRIHRGNYGPQMFDALRTYQGAIELRISDATISDIAWGSIGRMEALEKLSIWSSNINDTQLRSLMGLKTLKHMELSERSISDGALGELARLGTLETLTIHGRATPDTLRLYLNFNSGLQLISFNGYPDKSRKDSAFTIWNRNQAMEELKKLEK